MKNYISEVDKVKIERFCSMKIKNGDLIRVKSLAVLLEEKYCLYDILSYMKDELKISSDKIWRGEIADYIIVLPRGHVQISPQDLYFSNEYYHRYVVAKELNIGIKKIKQYIIHHIDEDKANNDIQNLFIFYDVNSHIAYHQALKHDINLDIKKFNEEYIETVLNQDNAEKIRDYLKVLDKKNTYQSLLQDDKQRN